MVLAASNVLARIKSSATVSAAGDGSRLAFAAMGTRCQVTFTSPSRRAGDAFAGAVLGWVAEFEARYSRFLPESLTSKINASAGREWVSIDPETERLLAMCREFHFFTRGVFDPTALPLIRLWDWNKPGLTLPDPAAVVKARDMVGWRHVQVRPGGVFLSRAGMLIDFGGVGKEYAADRVCQIASEYGMTSLLVDFGHDVRSVGTPPGKPAWHIGLEDPKQPGKCWTGVAARDVAVATSGDYLRNCTIQGKRYGHIIDPRSGYPVDNGCRAVSVIAPSCTIAGILSTTAFILGVVEGLKFISNYFGAEGCILTEESRHETRRFAEYLTH